MGLDALVSLLPVHHIKAINRLVRNLLEMEYFVIIVMMLVQQVIV